MAERRAKTVVLSEQVSTGIEQLLEFGRRRGRLARQTPLFARRTQPVHTVRPDKPDITELLRAELTAALEDEIVPAMPVVSRRGISDWEFEREVVKKALVGLKLQSLKQIADELKLDKRGRIEEIAERIARIYRYDEHEIAQLILDNEDEPEPDRGHSDRIFPLQRPIDMEMAARRLRVVTGRYVRVGVARWFVFDAVEVSPNRIVLNGTLRSYRVSVTSEDDPNAPIGQLGHSTSISDDMQDKAQETTAATLGSRPSESDVRVTIERHAETLRIRGKSVSAARAATRALESVAHVELLGRLPLATHSFSGPLGSFAESTVFMLDLLDNRLVDAQASSPNLTVARFETEQRGKNEDKDDEDPESEARPRIREVRFEGDHLLDSLAACRLIALDGRALIELSLRVSFGIRENGEPARFPIRVSLERDHALVLTGFGRESAALSAELQRQMVRAVEHGLNGVKDTARLEALAKRIDSFARANQEADRPAMLR